MASKTSAAAIIGVVGVGIIIYMAMKKTAATTAIATAVPSSLANAEAGAISSAGSALSSLFSSAAPSLSGMGRLPLRNRRRY